MGMHGSVGEHEHHIRAAGAAFCPGLEFEGREIGDEIRFPHVAARAHRYEFAFAAEMRGRTLALREFVRVVEDEGFVVEQIELETKFVDGGKPRALRTARIEMLVAGIERQREQALRTPLETMLAAVAGFNSGAAITGQ